MDRPPFRDAQASNLQQASINMAEQKLARMEADRLAAERAFIAHVESLTARVAVLEASLRALQMCTVQQHADGRLSFPVGDKFTLDAPGPPGPFGIPIRLRVDLGTCHVDAPRPYSASAPRPAGQLAVPAPAPAAQRPYVPPAPTGSSGQSLQSMASQGGWQSTAAGNGVANPRQLQPGQLTKR